MPFYKAALGAILLIYSFSLKAQTEPDDQEWQYVSTDYIKVYFQGDQGLMAERVAKYAERARLEVGRLYDFSPTKQYTLYYFPTSWESQAAFVDRDHNDRQGSFKLLLPEAKVIHPGTQAKLYASVKKAVARLCLEELSGGTRFFAKLQSHNLLYSLAWYSEGIAAYVGEGWDEMDELNLVQLLDASGQLSENNKSSSRQSKEELLDKALEGDNALNALARKSLWQYIGAEYGDEKIAEIIYLADISHSLNIGTVSVLGVTLPTLTSRWQQYCLDLVESNAKGRPQLGANVKDAPIPEGMDLLGFSYEPKTDRYAMYLSSSTEQQVFIWKTGEDYLEETPIVSKVGARSKSVSFEGRLPVAWSKDGKKLVAPRMSGGDYVMTYLDLEATELLDVPVQHDVSNVLSIDWSHNGNLLVLSGLYRDRSAIFIGKPEAENFRLLSRDAADYQEPIFSFDDRWLYFASNRSIDTITWEIEKDWNAYQRTYDLWGLDRDADTILRVSNTPNENERMPAMNNSFELWYRTDYSGVPSVARRNLFTGEASIMTDFAPGISAFGISEKKLIVQTIRDKEPALLNVSVGSLQVVDEPVRTITRKARVAALNKKQKALAPSLPPILSENNNEPDEQNPSVEAPAEDSVKKKPAARYYIFDDDVTPYEAAPKKTTTPTPQRYAATKRKPDMPDLGRIQVAPAEPAINRWEAEHASLMIDRDPLAGYIFGLEAHFADRFHKQSLDVEMAPIIGLYENFKGTGGLGRLRYTRHAKSFDYFVEGQAKSYVYRRIDFVSDSIQNRYSRWQLGLGVEAFPIWNVRLGLRANLLGISKKDLYTIDLQRTLNDANDQFGHAAVTVAFDNRKGPENFPTEGWDISMEANAWQGFSDAKVSMQRIEGDFKKYTRLPNNIVWASRIKGGVGFGNTSQRFFVGGTEGWVVPPLFFNREDLRTSQDNNIPVGLYENHFAKVVSPVRGFWFFSRSGDKYVVMNQELRIPIRRLNRRTLPERSLQGISFVPFLDVGTAWTEGNPFSSRNKYPTETRVVTNGPVTVELQTLKSPFILGFGTGLHAEVLSYLVKLDVAWSVDDNTLQSPAIMISIGNRF